MEDHSRHKKVFLKVLFINIAVFIAELIVALYSGSLTMLSDSFHVFIHIIASLIGFISEFEFLGLAPEKIKRYAALINVGLFFVGIGVIIKEAIGRFADPPELILDYSYFLIASLGLVANIYSARIIDKAEHHECSQNMATLHACMIYDAAGSAVVIIGALAMVFTKIFILDPILSIALVIFMVIRGKELLNNTLHSHQ